MNIAFTTILLFIILAPGFLARKSYLSSKLSIRDPNKSIINELVSSIIPSFSIHVIFILIINFLGFEIDFEQLGNLILGVKESSKVEKSFQNLDHFKYHIFLYNIVVYSFSFFIGYFLRKIVRYFKFDIKWRYLRFSNKWHYIFSGECLDFPDVPDEFQKITDKIINILCSVNGKNILYTGEFFNYYIDKNGNLEAVHLRNPIRRYLQKDKSEKEEENNYYVIPSRYLVIPNSDLININFRYFSLTEVNEDELSEDQKNKAIKLNEDS